MAKKTLLAEGDETFQTVKRFITETSFSTEKVPPKDRARNENLVAARIPEEVSAYALAEVVGAYSPRNHPAFFTIVPEDSLDLYMMIESEHLKRLQSNLRHENRSAVTSKKDIKPGNFLLGGVVSPGGSSRLN